MLYFFPLEYLLIVYSNSVQCKIPRTVDNVIKTGVSCEDITWKLSLKAVWTGAFSSLRWWNVDLTSSSSMAGAGECYVDWQTLLRWWCFLGQNLKLTLFSLFGKVTSSNMADLDFGCTWLWSQCVTTVFGITQFLECLYPSVTNYSHIEASITIKPLGFFFYN